MNAYRKQQLQAAELIEQGATAEQIAEVYGWTKTRADPEPIETGDKRTLTQRRKCGIIKAMRRYIHRWKQKQEGKKMLKIQWLNGESRTQETPCIYAIAKTDDSELYAEYLLSEEEIDADGEPTEEADAAAAEYLRSQIIEQAKENGLTENDLDFRF